MPYPAAHFELGRLQAAMGESERARQHYGAFLDAVTDPDPEYGWMVEEGALILALGGTGVGSPGRSWRSPVT